MPKACLVGSGIASLAAAAYLIRDGRFPGDDIHIFEQADIEGGSLRRRRLTRHGLCDPWWPYV